MPCISALMADIVNLKTHHSSTIDSYFDSGANRFFYVERSAFKTYTPVNMTGNVAKRDDTFQILGTGTVELRVQSYRNASQFSIILLEGVLH
ncbi:hypothetical protein C8J56DRAFT_1165121, partial [Mycena floridula]